jgi:hypothetical protein
MMFETRLESIISAIVAISAIVVMLMDLFVWRPF